MLCFSHAQSVQPQISSPQSCCLFQKCCSRSQGSDCGWWNYATGMTTSHVEQQNYTIFCKTFISARRLCFTLVCFLVCVCVCLPDSGIIKKLSHSYIIIQNIVELMVIAQVKDKTMKFQFNQDEDWMRNLQTFVLLFWVEKN